jgi:hypothetical protein
MKRKIIVILVGMLMIAATTTLVAGKEKMMPSVIDQQQPNTSEKYWLPNGVDTWQQFKNRGKTLEKIELHVQQGYEQSYPITLSIVQTLGGTPLTQVTYQAIDLPNTPAWFTFDVPDVKLKANTVYYMVLSFDPGSEYAWSGAHGDPYPNGSTSHPDADWDFAFRTIVDKPTIKQFSNPFRYFLKSHPRLFPLLHYLFDL